MRRRKNLERAVILGLLLSTSVYGSVWAEGPITEDSIINSPYTGDITFQGNDDSAIEVIDREVEISTTDGGTITLDSGKYGIRLEGTGSVILTPTGDNVIKVTANSTNNEIGDGINVTENAGGTITLNGANNTITVEGEHSDGIYTAVGSDTNIKLIATAGNNTITATNNGIDHRGNNTITLEANGGSNIIKSTNGDGIRVEGIGNVTLTAKENTITAGDNGIQVTGGGTVNVTATGNNTITANTNGIYASGENSSAVLNGYNTNITVANTNIDSSIRGIDADNSSKITINSNQDIKFDLANIGVYARGINGQNGSSITLTSENGSIEVNVSTGAPNANGGNVYGINLEGVNTKADLTAGQDIIITTNSSVVEQPPGAGANDVVGIRAQYGASVNAIANGALYINSTDENSTNVGIRAQDDNSYISVTANGMNKDGYGVNIISNGKTSHSILAQDGSVDIFSNAGSIYLGADAVEAATAINATAISNDVHTKLEANGDVILNAYNDTDITSNVNYVAGIFANAYNDYDNKVELTGNDIKIIANSENNTAYGIYALDSYVTLLADTNNVLTAKTYGIYADSASDVNLTAKGNNISASTAIWGLNYGQVTLTANDANNEITTTGDAVFATTGSKINLIANKGINYINSGKSTGLYSNGKETVVDLTAKGNSVSAGTGIKGLNNGQITLTANALNNEITTTGNGIDAAGNSNVNLVANQGINKVESGNSATAIISNGEKTVVNLTAMGNTVSANTGIWSLSNGQVKLNANGVNNEITTTVNGIYANTTSKVDLIANENSNIIKSGVIDENGFGNQNAIYAISNSTVTLDAGNSNAISGAVYASGHSDNAKTDVTLTGGANMVLSNAYIANAGGLANKNVISALYAEKGAHIKLDGDTNLLGTYAVSSSEDLERVVWAYDTADIDITGLTAISTDSYDLATNSKDIAVVAGTATGLEELTADEILGYDGDRANVDINYESDSSITGDILSAYAGTVNIAANTENTRAASDSKIDIRGNLLAGNNGILDVDLGNGGTLTGRADDYGDAGLNTGHGAVEGENSFFNPAFSSEIKANGTINLTMGEGSVWNVTGQSWITKLNTTENAADTLINLKNAKNEELNINASALTIGTLNGSTQFYMNLDGDRSASDMLYIKNADGQYNIYLQEEVTSSEINAGGFNGLRFATVGEGSNADFTVRSQGTGSAFDVVYTVGTDSYEGNSENTAYNSTTGEGGANTQKPGNASVDDFFGLANNATDDSEIATNGIMLMAENEEVTDNAANANGGLEEVTNFKIIARADEELNDTGETILNMSRANYSNAIYMDRLNKRLGEARYINDDPEEDEGVWVRIRHDRIGKDDAYRSQNTMYELGYDKKQDCDNGERRIGFAVDYMHGDTGYTDIAGKGEIDRYGLWLYDTWMGDKGHYVDYVAKWGHLDNDFEVYTMRDGNKVTGDYSNNVFSVSAEYGRKKDIGNDWYFEPQAQLQLARVTGADYTTNQGTKVSVDGINSLIGRAGFRIGKDFGEEKQSTLYFKADVLHEFLGDQDVYVMDKSTDNKWAGISYDNEGTWYDIGIGYAAMMSKSSYAFIDLEQSFGNDNDDTYQINAGVRWTF